MKFVDSKSIPSYNIEGVDLLIIFGQKYGDYCLPGKGDSMIDVGMQDADMAFLAKDFDMEDG